ncbi:hypothetical protein GCM10023340_36430 [Nocardioides marinquilinus]|uniref:Uncharacterized protein n=1 Tax=Nocardioides marinquilinus TaxID=1210400 RepID=A0ABP9Q4D4_9ACTN
MSTRTELATAANGVEGLTATPYFTSGTRAGTVWIRLDRIEFPDRFGGIAHWNVVLVLPQDQAESERYFEATTPALREALADHLVVTSVTPQRLQLDGVGPLSVAFINGHREAD